MINADVVVAQVGVWVIWWGLSSIVHSIIMSFERNRHDQPMHFRGNACFQRVSRLDIDAASQRDIDPRITYTTSISVFKNPTTNSILLQNASQTQAFSQHALLANHHPFLRLLLSTSLLPTHQTRRNDITLRSAQQTSLLRLRHAFTPQHPHPQTTSRQPPRSLRRAW